MRTVIANNACKFHEDRLNGGVTMYFIVANPRGSGETWSRFFATGALCMHCDAPCIYCQSTYVVQRVYGQLKSKNGIYISGMIAAVTAGQILVI